MLENSWVLEQLPASQEGLSPMALLMYSYTMQNKFVIVFHYNLSQTYFSKAKQRLQMALFRYMELN
jgi:hypothetical protein